jgi:hypothetical protein
VNRKCKFLRVHVRNEVRHSDVRLNIAVGHVAPKSNRIRFGLVVLPVVVPIFIVMFLRSALGAFGLGPRSYYDKCHGSKK